jgi:2-polyprenyl-3-methyl-5-hydroxy-6-metoxy-1,4-benzoquinol methylase
MTSVAQSWDAEYARGRYRDEAPVDFVRDVLAASLNKGIRHGLYIGCGNGRNYLPLVDGGLDLLGLDISGTAINQLLERTPARRDRLMQGDLGSLPASGLFDIVIGIQIFQHGNRSTCHRHIRNAQRHVSAGGLFAIRVNAAGTQVVIRHRTTEQETDGSFTVKYLDGPKAGLLIHFFAQRELAALFARHFKPVLPLRLRSHERDTPPSSHWCQWEGIWQRVA